MSKIIIIKSTELKRQISSAIQNKSKLDVEGQLLDIPENHLMNMANVYRVTPEHSVTTTIEGKSVRFDSEFSFWFNAD